RALLVTLDVDEIERECLGEGLFLIAVRVSECELFLGACRGERCDLLFEARAARLDLRREVLGDLLAVLEAGIDDDLGEIARDGGSAGARRPSRSASTLRTRTTRRRDRAPRACLRTVASPASRVATRRRRETRGPDNAVDR